MNTITIAIPLYNSEQYLERCLNSIFKQSFKDYEIIIVDDNSPCNHHQESVNEIIESYEKNKITLIRHEQNKGLFQSRLTALSKAKTPYICFVDSDDWLESQYLAKLHHTITKNDSDIAVSGFYYAKNNRNKMKSTPNLSNDKSQIHGNKEVTNAIYKEEIRHCVWNKLYKKQILMDSQILEVSSSVNQSEDLLFNSYAFLQAQSVSLINAPLYNYFLNTASMTNDFSFATFKKRADDIIIVMNEIKNLLNKKSLYSHLREDYNNRYIQQSYYLISNLQRGKLSEDLYYQAFNYLLEHIPHPHLIKSLHRSPVFKIATLIETKLLPPLTLRRYYTHILYNKLTKLFRKKRTK